VAIDTYANLQTAVLAWLNRAGDSDAAVRCPDWITLAEDELRMALNRLTVRQGEVVNAAFAISAEYTALPAGFTRLRAIKINANPDRPLDYVPPQVADRWGKLETASTPRLYTIQNNQLRVFPQPDTAYTATITYFALPSLSVSNTSNWLLAAHPKLYLSAALAEAFGYYDDSAKYMGASAERDRMLTAIATVDGSDKQGSSMRMRVDSGTP
jgi:hypothetical protein